VEKRSLLILLPALLVAPGGFCAPLAPDFSGTWKQSNERSTPVRKGDVTLRIVHHDPDLMVETTILRDSAPPRRALQHYTTRGTTSVSTGADEDEFRTSVVWNGPSLVFSIEEHEDGRIIIWHETWSLLDNGAAIERRRQREHDAAGEQTILYLRQVTSR
jgi:hypothetical protein